MQTTVVTLFFSQKQIKQENMSELDVHSPEYSHQKARNDIDKMNKELDQLKEDIFKAKVQSHILHVDLTTQFSPDMVEKLRTVKEDCDRCSKTVNIHLKSDINQ